LGLIAFAELPAPEQERVQVVQCCAFQPRQVNGGVTTRDLGDDLQGRSAVADFSAHDKDRPIGQDHGTRIPARVLEREVVRTDEKAP
jgi:hypothetical protein